MSKVLKAITNSVTHKDYPEKTKDVQQIAAEMGVPQAVVGIKEIPRVEKQAISRDTTDFDTMFLNDPVGRLREITKKDLLYLMNSFLGFKDVSPYVKYHQELAAFYDRGFARMVVLLPRWHFKTTFGAGFIVRDFLRNPDNTWMIESATDTNAKQMFELIQTGLVSDAMQLVWGDLRANVRKPKWGGKELNISMRSDFSKREPSLYWRGVNSEATGQHPDNGLFDDVSAEMNCETPDQRQKIKDRYDRKMLIVKNIHLHNATRWHYDDLIGYILAKNKNMNTTDKFKFQLFKRDVYDDFGEPLFALSYRNPDKPISMYDREWIEHKRTVLGSYLFGTQMMNNPLPEEDQVFKEEWLEPWYYDNLNDIKDLFKDMNFYITVDPASSSHEGDNTGIIVCGVTPKMDIYVVEDATDRMRTNDAINKIFELAQKWEEVNGKKPIVGIEQGHYEHEYRQPLKDLMRMRKTFFSRRKLKYGGQPGTRSRAKEDRVRSLQPYCEAGIVHIGRRMSKLQDELIYYGSTKHDDRADALAYVLQLIKRPAERLEQKEKTRVEKWLDRKRFSAGTKDLHKFINQEALTTR